LAGAGGGATEGVGGATSAGRLGVLLALDSSLGPFTAGGATTGTRTEPIGAIAGATEGGGATGVGAGATGRGGGTYPGGGGAIAELGAGPSCCRTRLVTNSE